MIPSNRTIEIAARARMEDRAYEAEQYRRARLVSQGSGNGWQTHTTRARPFVWLRWLATHIVGGVA
jgi:hypothetical protein